jgi:hypothetical protein
MNLAALAAAIITVESGGNDLAIGDGGRSVGAYQISRGVVADVNRIHGTRFTWTGMTNREHAGTVFQLYVSAYCTESRLGHPPTEQDVARIWNAGPLGHRRKSAIPYWKKVKREIQNRRDR